MKRIYNGHTAPCTITYPGSDGIARSTEAILTTDHAQSSYGLPVVVVEPRSSAPPSPALRDLIEAFTAVEYDQIGSRAELLPSAVYGTADLPHGAVIDVHWRIDREFFDGREYIAIDQTAATRAWRTLVTAARHVGYPLSAATFSDIDPQTGDWRPLA